MTVDEPTDVVSRGYDALAPSFGEWMSKVEGDPWERFVDELGNRVPEGARILDLGCGNGEKTRSLSRRFDVLGVDVSRRQLELARAVAPDTTFLHSDFTELDFPDGAFDAVTAFYSVMHVPREQHALVFARILRWLRPGGLFLASLSHVGGEDWTGEWLGVEMFFSGFDAETNRELLRDAGFELLVDELVFMREPQGEVGFLWVLARKPE